MIIARNTRGDLDRGSRLSALRRSWDEYVLNGFTVYLEMSAKRDYVALREISFMHLILELNLFGAPLLSCRYHTITVNLDFFCGIIRLHSPIKFLFLF